MADKTEAPTQRRLEDARAEGQVVRSQELNTAAALLVGALLLQSMGKNLASALQNMVVTSIGSLPGATVDESWLRQWGYEQVMQIGPTLGMIMIILLAAGVTVTLAQTRFLWATKKMGFDLKRLNPLAGFQRIFSGQGLVELAKALLKLALVGWVAYSILRGRVQDLLALSQTDLASATQNFVDLAIDLALRVGAAYLVLAIADYAYQRWRFMRSMRMSKEEIKEEFKRSEGDPLLRSRIRGQQRRIARMRMMASVPKANVVITNPTHLAVALQYNPETMGAPRVVAKGAYNIAQRIADIARSNGIPVIQNIPVARALYKAVEIDHEIPPEMYVAVAEVLAYVFRLSGQKSGKAHL
ncbi:MAG: flagellar biosynthesis protein FlhB [Anaerolineaceae bacterium]|nr:flagellar biosynthesis protein FlhB [Anaerolineaceae bacterium]